MSEPEKTVEREYILPNSCGPNGSLFYYNETHFKNGVKDGLALQYCSSDGKGFILHSIALYKDGKNVVSTSDHFYTQGILDFDKESKVGQIVFHPDGSIRGIKIKTESKTQLMFFEKGVAKSVDDLTPENSNMIRICNRYGNKNKDVFLSGGEVVSIVNRQGETLEFSATAVRHFGADGTTVIQEQEFANSSEKSKASIDRDRSLEEYRLELDPDTINAIQQASEFYEDASHGKYVFLSSDAKAFIDEQYRNIDYSELPPHIAERLRTDSEPTVTKLRGPETPTPSESSKATAPNQNVSALCPQTGR